MAPTLLPPTDNPLLQSIRQEATMLAKSANATSTNATSATAVRSFLIFLEATGQRRQVDRDGITDQQLSEYCTLAVRNNSLTYKTLRNYISMGVRVYHLERNLQWTPISERYEVLKTLKAIRRALGDVTTPVLAITLPILGDIINAINSQTPCGACLAAAWSCAFFLILRKGNIVSAKDDATNSRQPIKRKHLTWDGERFWIKLVHTKTIQYGEREIMLPVPYFPETPEICPTFLLNRHLTINKVNPEDNLFSYSNKPLSYTVLLTQFKWALKRCGIDHTKYAGHSFRRGGATWMFSVLKLPSELIRILGDWKSQAYLLYTTVTDSLKLDAINAMQTAVACNQLGDRIAASTGGNVGALVLWNPNSPEQ